jgi:hypothetical protein
MSYPKLNPKYFDVLDTEEASGYHYQIVRPKGNPLILFSISNPSGPIPIASVHLETQSYEKQNDNIGNRGKALFTKRWQKSSANCDFQGIITQDKQDYEFVLTNLTIGDELININILKKNVKVTEVDPGVEGHSVNMVNEINPFSSYAVQSDQKDNCSLILETIKNEEGKPCLSVKTDEKQGEEKTQGTYYWLRAIPPKGGKNEFLFEKTKWACVDYFILKYEKITPSETSMSQGLTVRASRGNENQSKSTVCESGLAAPRTVPTTMATPMQISKNIEDQEKSIISVPKEMEVSKDDDEVYNNIRLDDTETAPKRLRTNENGNFIEKNPHQPNISSEISILNSINNQTNTKTTHNNNNNNDNNNNNKNNNGSSDNELSENNFSTTITAETVKHIDNSKNMQSNEDIINMSHAVKVESGRTIMSTIHYTGVKYNFDLPSDPCKIGLSIFEGLVINQDLDDNTIIESAKTTIQDYIKNAAKAYLDKLTKIYPEESCCICLEKKPNIIIFQCGHQCLHDHCRAGLKMCPLCRSQIRATIKN